MKTARKPHSKLLITFWSTVLLFVFYNEATAVQAVEYKRPVDVQVVKDWVRSEVTVRATSDVELRRLMKLFYAKKIDSENLYEHLRKMRPKS